MQFPTRRLVSLLILTCLAPVTGASATNSLTVIHNFSGSDGLFPGASLIRDKAGNLYGTTIDGGTGMGTVFELRPNKSGGWNESVLYSFAGPNNNDGAYPTAQVTFDAHGNLFGTTAQGGVGSCNCGTVFELSPNGKHGWTETVIHSFQGFPDLNTPSGGVTFDAAGNFYGSSFSGGGFNYGGIYEFTNSSGWQEQIIHSFHDGTDGRQPQGTLVLHGQALFGITVFGEPYNGGTVFKLKLARNGSWKLSNIYSFGADGDGETPTGDLAFDTSGHLYGTTEVGGAYGEGILFRLSFSGGMWQETILHSFGQGNDGTFPSDDRLVIDSAGNIYGTTPNGGTSSSGTVFVASPVNGQYQEQVLYNFTNGNDGGNPSAGLLLEHGKLYGTAPRGGSGGGGVVFEIAP